jgi:hypothetical protein
MDPAMAGAGQQLLDEQRLESAVAAQLRRQRAVLERLASDIAAHISRLPGVDGAWRSPAQRAFARRCDDLDEQLRAAWSALESAVADVDRDLARLGSAASGSG